MSGMIGAESFRFDIQGFAAYGLRNASLELAIIPELGAKLTSLKAAGREWMWHPSGELRLFRNSPGEPFEDSTLAGADECIPTIAPCVLSDRNLPDHGEVWASPWQVDESAFAHGILCTRIRFPISPLRLERRLRIDGNDAIFEYTLENLSDATQPYLWAFHPLFPVEPRDRIELPPELMKVTVGAMAGALQGKPGARIPWPEPRAGIRLDCVDAQEDAYAKLFADFTGLPSGWAAIRRGKRRLVFVFSPAEIPYLGIWFTRRQWNGHTHMALEPTSTPSDSLAEAANAPCLPAGASRQWSFRIRHELTPGTLLD